MTVISWCRSCPAGRSASSGGTAKTSRPCGQGARHARSTFSRAASDTRTMSYPPAATSPVKTQPQASAAARSVSKASGA
ncbi:MULTISPECIES: hypothetical protein [Anaerotruncus]|uniref:hypothetical protein n=1 Tax=Anaerotruncus TaxID=244127 RepID=UPI003A8B32D8